MTHPPTHRPAHPDRAGTSGRVGRSRVRLALGVLLGRTDPATLATPRELSEHTDLAQPVQLGEGTGGDPHQEQGRRWSPSIQVGARVLAAAGELVAVLAVTGYPAEVGPGWLDALLAYPGRLDVSVHLRPIDPNTAPRLVRRQRARLAAAVDETERRGQVSDEEVHAAADDADTLARRLATRTARLFRVGLYLAVYADHPDTLADEVTAVRALAESALLDLRPATWQQLDAWASCLPTATDRLGVHRVMDTDPAAAGIPFTSPDLPAADPIAPHIPVGVLYGLSATSQGVVCLDRFSPEAHNYNSVVLGRMGSGKSWLVKLEALRYLYRGVDLLVLDPEDEYTTLARAVGGTVIRLGAPGVTINPLDLPIHHTGDGHRIAPADAVTRRALFAHTFLTVLLGAELSAGQRAVLDQAVTATYRHAGIHPDQPDTWTRPAPLLADLAADLTTQPHPGPDLATRLHPFIAGSYAGLFDSPTSIPDTGNHLISYSLRELPDELHSIATTLALDHIWRAVSHPIDRRPRLVIVDEAWTLMAQPAAARWLWRMAKKARKLWAGLSFVSQDIDDVLASPLGMAIITNAATHVLLRQATHSIDAVTQAFALSDGERAMLLCAGRGHALICHGDARVAAQIVASPREACLVTTNPAERAALLTDPDTGYITLPDTNLPDLSPNQPGPIHPAVPSQTSGTGSRP